MLLLGVGVDGQCKVQILVVQVLGEAAYRQKPVFNDHMQHVLVHYYVVVAFDSLESVCNNRYQQVNEHDLQEEGGDDKEKPGYLGVIITVDVCVVISQGDLVDVGYRFCHPIEPISFRVVL